MPDYTSKLGRLLESKPNWLAVVGRKSDMLKEADEVIPSSYDAAALGGMSGTRTPLSHSDKAKTVACLPTSPKCLAFRFCSFVLEIKAM